ncbi:SusC/RagA family TonB-linked outer membrane protein [Pedobacter sp. MC2016-05]|uniref:SusC/RagA family TonB-linked outer membrane protein n=1 Tax=Pedobacter sp. MC2016-05 TaxID=2994474 RepID=UPI002247BB6A|nr:SusC/RagA family TonB-linked outer membrane protein [Pedobacter sp. MC2016-05]MCX2472810.1 SusC/RagA family TonB-linked outer membrane protein [Pedobacter sp. MC2016-05]
MKKLLQSLFILMFVAFGAMAQERTITGTVTSADDKLPIPGVSVRVKGTTTGTVTDANGKYSVRVASGSTLEFSYIGYTAQSKSVGTSTSLNVVLQSDSKALTEVVVTALGISRQKKDLGYAATTVTSKEITQAKAVNAVNGLQGKVSGMNITTTNSGVFENVKINLRGIRSLTGNNNPLLLLDGVQSDINYLSSINPNDIESVNVLKGSAGAALYGPDARNGVIVVTTKKGSRDDKPVITLSNSTQFTNISFFPKFQEKFGLGGSGEYIPYENWSWGPAFDGSTVELGHELPDGTIQTTEYSPNNERKEFFNTGVTMQNDVSFAAKDFYLSFQDANIKGIVPDDKNRRTGIRLNVAKEYGKFKVGFNTNYSQQNYNVFDDAAMSSYNAANNVGLNGGLMNLIFNTPAYVPLTSYKDFNGNKFATYNNYFTDYGLNPYFALDNWRKEGKREDLISNLELNFKATDWLNLTYRAAITTQSINERRSSKGEIPDAFGLSRSFKLIPGAIEERAFKNTRLSSEAFAAVNKQLGSDFKLTAIVGTYLRQDEARDNRLGATSLVVPELFNVGNRVGQLTGSSPYQKSRLLGIYGSAGLNYKGWANIEVTGRNDQTSVLGLQNNSFFYPGVSGAVVLSDAIEALKNNKVLSYLKLRGAWNKTGNADISPYLLAATFSQPTGFPIGTLPGYTANNTTYDANLKPEFIESFEAGLEAGFLNGRLSLEGTYFNQKMTDQIIPINVSASSGYTSAFVNAAAFDNKGFELDLKLTPLVDLGEVRVNLRANATYNTTNITQIYAGLPEVLIGGYTNSANYAVNGYPAFVIKATDYVRDPDGRVVVSPTTGLPTQDPTTKIFGQTMPKWILGLNPSVSWKGLNVSALFEYKTGHYAYHDIGQAMAWTGVGYETASNNRSPFVFPNSSIRNTDGSYSPNTNVAINSNENFYTGVYRNVGTNFLTSAASWRLREVSIGYDIPVKILGNQNVIKGLSVALTGRNLALWLPKTNIYTDPDFTYTDTNTSFGAGSSGTATSNRNGISDSSINPPTRTFGGNITITF